MKYIKEICRSCIESEKGDVYLMDCSGCGFKDGMVLGIYKLDQGYCPSGVIRIMDECSETGDVQEI